MKTLAICLMATLPFCANASDLVPVDLIGQWQIADSGGVSLPDACKFGRIEITRDGKFRDSGAPGSYAYSATIRVHSDGNGYFVYQTLTSHNGLPNCQGLPATYVSSHFKSDIYLEVNGDRLRYFFWEPGAAMFLDYRRVTGAP